MVFTVEKSIGMSSPNMDKIGAPKEEINKEIDELVTYVFICTSFCLYN